jgi:bifunctional DNase/RNase
VILELRATLTSVIIHKLSDDIYYASLVLDADGRHVEVDSRPSDAIALAVRMKAPIYVTESILDQAGVALQDLDDHEPLRRERRNTEDNLEVYREFINSLQALDDFGDPD